MRVLWAFGVAVAFVASGCKTHDSSTLGASTTRVDLHGDGATFPQKLYEDFARRYPKIDPTTSIAYTGTGSGHGVDSIVGGKVDFGGSDVPMDASRDPKGEILQIPGTLGGVVVGYSLPSLKHADGTPAVLRVSAPVLAQIFGGGVVRWNERAIAELNEGTVLPDKPITVVYRSGSSGTTGAFTDFLSRAGAWPGGRSMTMKAVGAAVDKNEDVADRVGKTEGAVGYLDFAYAIGHVSMAAVRNAAGAFVVPTLETIAAAAASVRAGSLLDSLANAPGQDSYPIVSYSFLLVRRSTADRDRGVHLARFLWWLTHDGQRFAPQLGYVTLPAATVVRVESLLGELRAGGAPSLEPTGS